ncbi:MAG TPA: GH25 family lysozyme [Candidatus Paceibacterota bacterium]
MTTFTVDVSRYNYDRGEINWSRVRSNGIEVATVLASEGNPAESHFYNPTFLHTIGMARQAGIRLIGGYHMLHAGDRACINRQVGMLLGRAKASGGLEKGWWMVDVEPLPDLQNTPPQYSDLLTFQDHWLEVTDGYPLAVRLPYLVWKRMGAPSLNDIQGPIASSDVPIITNLPFIEHMHSEDNGGDWVSFGDRPATLHHFCSTNSIPGISALCDVSAFRGTVEQFISLATVTRMGTLGANKFEE